MLSFADHCGISTGKVDLWNRDENLKSTALALEFLAKHFASVPNVIGLELLNEPANDKRLPKWYQETINNIRRSTPPDFPL
jgi:glucan 1,3-beta-glucosidase